MHSAIKQVKFLAFANGYTELCEFLQDADFGINWYSEDKLHLNWSPWLDQLWDDMAATEDPPSHTDLTWADHKGRMKQLRALVARERLLVRQARKCGITVPDSHIEFAHIKLKP